MAAALSSSMLPGYLGGLLGRGDAAGRARALLVTGSYDEARSAAAGVPELQVGGRALEVRYLVRPGARPQNDARALERDQLEAFGHVPAPAVLVAPLAVVARGHNILQPGTDQSAVSGIFVLTRPVPPTHDATRFLAHVSYAARAHPTPWRGGAHETVKAERGAAWRNLRQLQASSAVFSHMDSELRREIICDVLVALAQLAGRARRGGTPVDLHFVDAAFDDGAAPWPELVRDVLDWWRERGVLSEMMHLHGALVHALAEYAELTIPEV
jgi:hypothetical protein